MDYLQAVEWVHGLPRIARHCGVENTKLLLEKLGHPEGSSLCAHIRHQWKRKYNCHVGKCTKGSRI
mgnify:CR=1 FL=1